MVKEWIFGVDHDKSVDVERNRLVVEDWQDFLDYQDKVIVVRVEKREIPIPFVIYPDGSGQDMKHDVANRLWYVTERDIYTRRRR
jgi:hypothetical protein